MCDGKVAMDDAVIGTGISFEEVKWIKQWPMGHEDVFNWEK